MKLNLLAVFAVLLLAKLALAGGSSVGNGGNTIVCTDGNGQIKSVELLDFYEAQVKRGITPNLGDDSVSVDDKVKMAIDRLTVDSRWFSEDLQYEYNIFKQESVFLPGIRLVTVDDSDHLFVPAGCQQEQTAIQREPELPGDKLYNIDQDLWNHMDSNNRAGLILHEIVYRLAIKQGNPEDSVPVRFLVSSIASSPDLVKQKDLTQVLRLLKFKYVTLDGYEFAIDERNPQFNYDGTVWGGPLAIMGSATIQNNVVGVSEVYFNVKQQVSSVKLTRPAYLKFADKSVWFAADRIFLNDDQSVQNGMAIPQNLEFKRDGQYDLHLSESMTSPTWVGAQGTQLVRCDSCQGQVTVAGEVLDVDKYELSPPFTDTTGHFSGTILVNLAHPTSFTYAGLTLDVQGRLYIAFDSEWQPTLAAPTRLKVGQNNVLFGAGRMDITPQGEIRMGFLGEDETLPNYVGNTSTPYLKGMDLVFDENGKVLTANYDTYPNNP